jgi:hypothetical protein
VCSLSFGDAVTCRQDFRQYQNIDPEFYKTTEFMFLDKLLEALDQKDHELVGPAVGQFQNKGLWNDYIQMHVYVKLQNISESEG